MTHPNPFLALDYEPAVQSLGEAYADEVVAAEFPQHLLRFRNDDLLPQIGLNPSDVADGDFIQAFGKFEQRMPLLALRYHGYQFGEYNPRLGDGRGFLYGQVWGTDGELYDFGTKGSGTTPYSRGGDGRLTLKGGVREVLAAEMLHRMGVRTSRCLSLIETGEELWRGDEPSPTRSSVMIRFSRSHIRFGTFERLNAIGRPDLIGPLLDHVIHYYYGDLVAIADKKERYLQFYDRLVQRTVDLVAQWTAAGFCHAVLNTDNMSITGESFDYGPYAFIPTYDAGFTAAYFDYYGRYSYGNQPGICEWNLEMLQRPLAEVMPLEGMQAILKNFGDRFHRSYAQRMLEKLGFPHLAPEQGINLVRLTVDFLLQTQVSYPGFFGELRRQFSPLWLTDVGHIFRDTAFFTPEQQTALLPWKQAYYQCLQSLSNNSDNGDRTVTHTLKTYNPFVVILRPEIEAVWEEITHNDNWHPFQNLLDKIKA
ncbi:YdiU family protein [Candidatus Synechococcus calcipolaris G9]|uniref:Protein nucleotidyltransferase YdiU n=1 Tax=Candidatus Synechococcus calcipolaris G9 TaxID=1497997 RepID=A0ABT6EWQ6_9SYNE|nr:YdiU family protein [Candidatus Synechococcus calcipolaris]MDG2990222.1 YdiU family protein [Candidatus Synechococcus calcipolaris G9]